MANATHIVNGHRHNRRLRSATTVIPAKAGIQ